MVEGRGLSSNQLTQDNLADSKCLLDVLCEWAVIFQTKPAIVY